ncbi:hypothetical protein PO909_023928 [Leuciscus waleckii]
MPSPLGVRLNPPARGEGSDPGTGNPEDVTAALQECRVTSLRWIYERKPRRRIALQRDELEFEDVGRIAQQALFSVKSTSPMLSVGPRRKKRRSQRPPEPSVKENSPAASPRASFSESTVSFLGGQRLAAVETMERDVMEDDSCSLLASGREEWLGSIPDPAPSTQESSVRASVDAELLRLLTKAVEDLGLEWTTPQEPVPNRLDGCFLTGHRSTTVSRPALFLPELHDELSRSWGAPYSARLRSSVSSTLSAVDGAKDRGYLSVPPVEEAVATHLCPPSAGGRAKSTLPTKACRTTSALIGRAYAAAGQAASALHSMAVLQIHQANLLRSLDEAGPTKECVTDLVLRATKPPPRPSAATWLPSPSQSVICG